MELIKKHSRLLQIKEGNKIIFEILISKSGNRFNSFQYGLGLCNERKSLSECIIDTFEKIDFLNNELNIEIIKDLIK